MIEYGTRDSNSTPILFFQAQLVAKLATLAKPFLA
jgi:hypothetical protein